MESEREYTPKEAYNYAMEIGKKLLMQAELKHDEKVALADAIKNMSNETAESLAGQLEELKKKIS